MKIGMKAPDVRVPCIINNQFNFLALSHFQKKKFALCCLQDLQETDAWLLQTQDQEFEKSGSALITLVFKENRLGQGWVRPPLDFDIPLFLDPINRLQKRLHLSTSLRPNRCETLIFDHNTKLRFRLIHDLSLKGFFSVLDIMKSRFVQDFSEKTVSFHKPTHHSPPQGAREKASIDITS